MSNSIANLLRKMADEIDNGKPEIEEVTPVFRALKDKKQCKYCLDMVEYFTFCVGGNIYCLECAKHILENKTDDIEFSNKAHERVIKNLSKS